MKSVDRAIHTVEEKISQSDGRSTVELQDNLKCVFFFKIIFVHVCLKFVV